jgi:hypothetical protein
LRSTLALRVTPQIGQGLVVQYHGGRDATQRCVMLAALDLRGVQHGCSEAHLVATLLIVAAGVDAGIRRVWRACNDDTNSSAPRNQQGRYMNQAPMDYRKFKVVSLRRVRRLEVMYTLSSRQGS